MQDSKQPTPRWLIIATGLLAFLALVLSAILLWDGDSAGGAVAGAIAFGLALFQYVPLVTEVSGFGVTAKLQREVRQAEEILEQVRSFALSFAQSNFHQMAWMNRMGTPSDDTIRRQIAALDNLMEGLNIGIEEQNAAKQPFLMMVGFDMLLALNALIRGLVRRKAEQIGKQISQHTDGKPIRSDDEKYNGLRAKQRAFDTSAIDTVLPEDYDKIRDISGTVAATVAKFDLNSSEKARIFAEAERAANIFADCVKAGTKTKAAEDFIKQEKGSGEYYKKVFGAT